MCDIGDAETVHAERAEIFVGGFGAMFVDDAGDWSEGHKYGGGGTGDRLAPVPCACRDR